LDLLGLCYLEDLEIHYFQDYLFHLVHPDYLFHLENLEDL
jgi:hypothetical protein